MSRSCPSCGETFPDEVFFCGNDGTITVQDQDPSDFDPRLGKQLGGYIVVARVADGAMGRVFEGRHPETRARVAIKVLHADVARDRISVERFKREYESAMEMDHDNVVKVLEFGETPDDSYFMTMEYLVGEELGKVLGAGTKMPVARALRVAGQVASALEYAHSFGFIHRDLKPDNIFLCEGEDGDVVRILDFGSVKLQMEMGAKLTAIGTTLGSPYYMSPEQATGSSDVDQRTDVFALGAIVYEMLTNKVAFEGANVAMILMKIMNEMPAPPSGLLQDCPAAVDEVVARALSKDKTARYGTAPELAEALARAYGLDVTAQELATVPEVELQRRLDGSGAPEPAVASAPAAASEPAPAALAPGAEGQEPEPSRPSEAVAGLPARSSGMGMGAMLGIAFGVVVVGSVLAYLIL